jgi:hypothetical protein
VIPQVLIRWTEWHPSMAPWEDEVVLKQPFSFAPAWGQAGSRGGENVSNSMSITTDSSKKTSPTKVQPRRSDQVPQPNMKYLVNTWM